MHVTVCKEHDNLCMGSFAQALTDATQARAALNITQMGTTHETCRYYVLYKVCAACLKASAQLCCCV